MQHAERGRCSHVESCELFPRFSLRASLAIWQSHYCDGAFEDCERYKRSVRGEAVSPGLLPNGKELRLTAAPGPRR